MRSTVLSLLGLAALITAFYGFKGGGRAYAPEDSDVEYEYYQFSTVESVIKGGVGRSRIISTLPNGAMREEKLENLFSVTGINISNLQSNDYLITTKLDQLSYEGWELFSANPGVYSDVKGGGIFLTRYLFRRPVE